MDINEISGLILNRSIMIHKELGPGLLESVYQRILTYELRKSGVHVATEVPIPVKWDGQLIGEGYKADLIVESKVLVELKSIEATAPVHRKQTLTYLKLTRLSLGLLINFGAVFIKDDLHRLVNNFEDL